VIVKHSSEISKSAYNGNFSLIAPSRPLLSAPIQICMNPLFTLYFNEILLGATFTGQVGAVKAQFPLQELWGFYMPMGMQKLSHSIFHVPFIWVGT